MIDESGAVVPDVSEINRDIDKQFAEEARKKGLVKCGSCDYYGTREDMVWHKAGQGH